MNSNQVKHAALSLAFVCVAILGCSSDGSDTDNGIAQGSVSSTETGSTVSTTGGSGFTTTVTGGKSSVAGTSAASTTQPVAGTSSIVASTGGSSATTGGSPGTGGSSAQATTGGATSNGSSSSTGGSSSSTGGNVGTGGSSVIACMSLNVSCTSSTTCCPTLTCQSGACRPALVATGGSSSTGGNVGTGSGAGIYTGGSSATTGGSPGTGGSSAQATTGGATSNGSSSSTGGSSSSTGGNVGTGGSSVIACTPVARPVSTTTTPAFTSCGKAVRDSLFPETTMNFADRFGAIAENNILALARTFQHSYLWKWNGSAWNQVTAVPNTTYASSELHAIAWNSTGTITLVGGHAQCASCSMTPRVFIGVNTTWFEASKGLPSWGEVVDLLYVNDKAFALVNYNNAAQIFSLEGSTSADLSWTLVQSFDQSTGTRLWATSKNDIFVVGSKIDSSGNSIGALLVHFDGCSWNQVVMPADVLKLVAIHGAEGTVVVIGDTGSHPVRMISDDLASWTRSDGDASSALLETSVWMSSPVSVLVGGGSLRETLMNGIGRLTMGVSPWSTSVIDSQGAREVFDLTRVPGTNSYLIASYQVDPTDTLNHPRVYRVTCQ